MDNRYANGKIYKLVNDVDSEIYVGSTCLPLHKRLYDHKVAARASPRRQVYAHLNKVGWDNTHIILIETYECSNKDELVRRERQWVDELQPSLNKYRPIRLDDEYEQYTRQYYIDNKEYFQQYFAANKDKRNEQRRQRRAKKKQQGLLQDTTPLIQTDGQDAQP